MSTALDWPMTEKERNSMPIRIDNKALEAAKIAASYKGLTVAGYVSKVLLEVATRDIEEGHKAWSTSSTDASSAPPPPQRPKRGGA